MSLLVVILLLPALFGGRVEATFKFETTAQCRKFYRQIEKFTVRHEVVQPCPAEETK